MKINSLGLSVVIVGFDFRLRLSSHVYHQDLNIAGIDS